MTEPVVKEFSEFTEQEKQWYRNCWVSVLDGHCPADEETGNRPCDWGCPCDRCHYDWDIQHEFAELLVSEGVPLTPREKKYLDGDT